jgi:hypothetical protein
MADLEKVHYRSFDVADLRHVCRSPQRIRMADANAADSRALCRSA